MKNPNSRNGKVRLWTRQDKKALHVIESFGQYRNTEMYIREKFGDISNYFLSLYDWFVEQAAQKVPLPRGVRYPIWCSVAEEYMLRPTADEIVFEIEKDEEEVIYFDGMKWDLVLNHLYIPKDAADDAAWNKHVSQLGVKNAHGFIEGPGAKLFPQERRTVMESWRRVFEIAEWDPFRLQANLWEIRKEEIVRVITMEEMAHYAKAQEEVPCE